MRRCMYVSLLLASDVSLHDRLQAFVPMAYTRLMLEKSGARFSDYFEQEMQGGDVEKRMLSSDPVWNASMAFARAEIGSGITAQDLLSLSQDEVRRNWTLLTKLSMLETS